MWVGVDGEEQEEGGEVSSAGVSCGGEGGGEVRDFNFLLIDRAGHVQVDLFLPGRCALVTSICKACGKVFQRDEGGSYADDHEHPHGEYEVAEAQAYKEEWRRDGERRLEALKAWRSA